MKIEHKLQIDAVKGERISYCIFENTILLTDGMIGCFYKKDEMKVDISKLIEMKKAEYLSPDKLMESTKEAKVTRSARNLGRNRFAIKLEEKDGKGYAYIDNKFLKMFYGCTGIKISESRHGVVLILKYGYPYGIVMPVNLGGEESEVAE